MTQHLSDEQLGALRDHALGAGDTAAAERHLAECAECRGRFAELAAMDAALAGALEHDPGEEYFASFADRVGARIAAAAPAAVPRRGLAAWWNSPRSLAWAGGALGLIAVAALVTTLAHEHGPQDLAKRAARAQELSVRAPAAPPASSPPSAEQLQASPSQGANESRELGVHVATPAPGGERKATAGRAPAAGREEGERAAMRQRIPAPASGGAARDEAAPSALRQRGVVAPERVVEVRTLPNGEQEIVPHGAASAPPPAPPIPLQGGGFKPAATPMAGQAQASKSLARAEAPSAPAPALKTAPAPAASFAPAPGADVLVGANAARIQEEVRGPQAVATICGKVLDSHSRPVGGASVSVAETGVSFTADAGGEYCVDVPRTGGTITAFAIGFGSRGVHVSAADSSRSVEITLKTVNVLGSPSVSFMQRSGGASGAAPVPAPAASTSLARRAAMDSSAAALKAETVSAWTNAAERWETLGQMESPGGDTEWAFHAAEARVNAWRIGHTRPQRIAARKATDAFLQRAGAGVERDIALGWEQQLKR